MTKEQAIKNFFGKVSIKEMKALKADPEAFDELAYASAYALEKSNS